MEQDFRKAFAIEDDEDYIDTEEYDDEESEEGENYSDSGASSAISRKQ